MAQNCRTCERLDVRFRTALAGYHALLAVNFPNADRIARARARMEKAERARCPVHER